ncbi:hypothetical protein HanHA300_Chr12g0454951 [Helianthus annuus]|nr:hypothetical protein HanHA300_Chr12g0454951 [Helianthus annuus]
MRQPSDTATAHHPPPPPPFLTQVRPTLTAHPSLSPAKIDGQTPASHSEAGNGSEPRPTVVQFSGPDTLSISPLC